MSGVVVKPSFRGKRGKGAPVQPQNVIPMRRVTFQVPQCPICNKEVEHFEMVRDGDLTTIVAYCHGDVSASKPYREEELDKLYSYKAFLDRRRTTFQGRNILTPTDYRELSGSVTDKIKLIQAFGKGRK